jgi:hypothetical protein
MVSDSKSIKTDATPKKDVAAKPESAAAKDAPKDSPKETSKTDAGETGAAPTNYSRGEGQKPVTAAYRENWNAIFGKRNKRKATKKKKR